MTVGALGSNTPRTDNLGDANTTTMHAATPMGHETRIARLPCWKAPVTVSPLSGGMTNHNYRVRCGSEHFVVRLGRDLPQGAVSALTATINFDYAAYTANYLARLDANDSGFLGTKEFT